MAKPSDFYVTVLDFFGALLPGAVTLGAAVVLDVPENLLKLAREKLALSETARIGAFLSVAYVLGQLFNSVGSFVLDWLYDRMYDPKHGLFSLPLPKSERPIGRLERLLGICERGSAERRKALEVHLRALAGGEEVRGVYQAVRAYLKIVSPVTFADVEKLEGDQKFFRCMTIGTLAVVVCFLPDKRMTAVSGAAAVGFAALLFARYVAVRRKTIERAYLYFALRHSFPEVKETSDVAARRDDD